MSSTTPRLDPVTVTYRVEASPRTATEEIPRDKWDAMTPQHRKEYVEEGALNTVNDAGGWGWSIDDPADEAMVATGDTRPAGPRRQYELDAAQKVDPREVKLPRWAFDKINLLRRVLKAEGQRADEARLATDPDGSSAVLDRFDGIPVGLGADAKVVFKLADGYEVHARVVGGRLELMGTGGGGSSAMVIQPQVTNTVIIWQAPKG